MSSLTELQSEIDRYRERIAELTEELVAREEALAILENAGVTATVEATVRASVTTQTTTRRNARANAQREKEISELIRGAGSGNVEAIRALMRQAKTLSQKDIASSLDINPSNVSRAVRALEAMGELRQTGEKIGRSVEWTTQGVRRRRATTEAW